MNFIGLPICLVKTQGIEPLNLAPTGGFTYNSICNCERLLDRKAGANIQRFLFINQNFFNKIFSFFLKASVSTSQHQYLPLWTSLCLQSGCKYKTTFLLKPNKNQIIFIRILKVASIGIPHPQYCQWTSRLALKAGANIQRLFSSNQIKIQLF